MNDLFGTFQRNLSFKTALSICNLWLPSSITTCYIASNFWL